MSLEQIWAPWRLAYIKGDPDQKPSAAASPANAESCGCFLCRYVAAAETEDRDNLVVLRGKQAVVVLNRYPYNNGHLLVAPHAHKATLEELDDAELLECGQLLRQLCGVLRRVMSPDGFNAGLNLGRVAGAGLPGHLHWHLVPRWNGDTNFMPVLGEVNVIPQSLAALYDMLTTELNDSRETVSPAADGPRSD